MPMSPREVVVRAVKFQKPDRIPLDLGEEYGQDIVWFHMDNNPDSRPPSGTDEWGCVWENIGVSNLGEVKYSPLGDWADIGKLSIPDIRSEHHWKNLKETRDKHKDKFLLAIGMSLYERVHFVRGLENAWMDIYLNRTELCSFVDILVDMNLYAIKKYSEAGADGYIFCDDWGLQDKLMISPEAWREIWKPRYARIYKAAHDAGLLTFLHSCGDITSILDDLIEIGLDVIQMDQQENMGLENLGKRFGGKITFWCPVDIQNTMVKGSPDEIREYCRKLVRILGRLDGGFIARWYSDPKAVGHKPEAINAMCTEFLKLSREFGK